MSEARAIVVTRPGELALARVGLPGLGPGEVLIRTLFSGVSTGTDKWVMQGLFTWRSLKFPLVPGYQRVGIVEAVGDEITTIAVGQQVVTTTTTSFTNAAVAWGGHASLAISPVGEVYDATGILPERASLFVSAQVGFNAASRIIEQAENRVVVYGDGIIGVSGALSARARGFDVLLVGRHPERLGPVAELGIAVAVGGDNTAVQDWRPTAVIDTVQNDAAFAEYAYELPERTGQIVYSGHTPNGVTFWADMAVLQKRELTASFVSGWTRDRIEDTLGLMRTGALPLERLAIVSDDPVAVLTAVREGTLTPVAAVLDWRSIQ